MKKKHVLRAFGLGFVLAGVIFLASGVVIGQGVKKRCNQALSRYGGDCVQALILQVKDEEASYSDRNSSIWALGQIGDQRALSVLESFYSGQISGRESWDKGISQYELKKGIKLLKGNLNATALIWRGKLEI